MATKYSISKSRKNDLYNAVKSFSGTLGATTKDLCSRIGWIKSPADAARVVYIARKCGLNIMSVRASKEVRYFVDVDPHEVSERFGSCTTTVMVTAADTKTVKRVDVHYVESSANLKTVDTGDGYWFQPTFKGKTLTVKTNAESVKIKTH